MSDLTTDELADLWHTYTRWEEGDDFGEHMASAVERIVAARAEAAEAKVAAVEALADEWDRTADECERLANGPRAGLSDESGLRTALMVNRRRADDLRAALGESR